VPLETGTSGVLSAGEVERFERDGYFVIEDPCPGELVDAVLADFEPLFRERWHPDQQVERDGVTYYRHGGWPEDGYHWHRILNAWRINDNARAMALAPRVLATVEELYGRKVKPFQTLNFPVGTEQSVHADSFHFQSDPPGFMCGVWIALEDMDIDNGPLVYYPGSHKLPMPTWDVIEKELGEALSPDDFESPPDFTNARHAQYDKYCRHVINQHGLEPAYATIRKGQALVWSANLLHGGSPHNDRTRTRHSQVTHYFFEGADRVYTPMLIENNHVYYWYPEWIRDPVPIYSTESLRRAIEEHVPAGAHVLLFSEDDEELTLADREVGRLDAEPDDSEAANLLSRLQKEGVEYIVFPKAKLGVLERQLPSLQDELEAGHRSILRDGAVCAIYALGE
jgi:ectoine hydroxylase-related dioxygenase (phytanoyl-CoA dioxygenase family)